MEDVDEEETDWSGEMVEWDPFDACNCDHDRDEHGWGECNVEGCECEGGWIE